MIDVNVIVNELSVDEKLDLISGKDFWHIRGLEKYGLPSIMVTDGPHGLRKQLTKGEHIGLSESVPATCYPTASLLASTWDDHLIEQLGNHLGKECLTEGVSVLLGPGTNIKRSPLCGRNFEYFSEDPLLSGRMASSWIKGVQSQGVGTSLKHFLLNNQESHRMVVDTIVDERTIREIYLKSFEIAVKASNPWTIMCSYNKVNGTYLSEHPHFLTNILRNEWNYSGLTMTDWGACNDRVQGIKAGLDLEMPGSHGIHHKEIKKALENGTLKIEELNLAVLNILNLILKSSETLKKDVIPYDKEEHHEFARKVASEGMVLLKNEEHLLPLKDDQKVLLIGEFAKKPRYQGNGSSLIKPTKLSTFYDAMVNRLKDHLTYVRGYSLDQDDIQQSLIDEALNHAENADVILIMAGLPDSYESEGFDRKHLHIPHNQEALIHAISSQYKNVIVILSNGAPVLMPWKDSVKGILECYLAGQASGLALMDIVMGDVNPSGKLAETFPNTLDELPASKHFPGEHRQVQYREGLYIGYRAYDLINKQPLFPFGYGLSYTSFEYSNLLVKTNEDNIAIHFKLKNIGDRCGKEIVQVYVSKEDSLVYRPMHELKAYQKIELQPNESKDINIEILKNDLSIYQKGYKIEPGKYQIKIGSSSKDILLEQEIYVHSDDAIKNDQLTKYHNYLLDFNPNKQDFEDLLEHTIPNVQPIKPYHLNSTLGEIKHTIVGKMIYKMVKKEYSSIAGDNPTKAMVEMIETSLKEMPLRSLVLFSDGKLSKNRASGMIDLLNHRLIRGIWKLIKG